jgi:hypothetical protein
MVTMGGVITMLSVFMVVVVVVLVRGVIAMLSVFMVVVVVMVMVMG